MKRLILPCAVWTLLTLVAGTLGVWRIHTHPIPGVPAEVRAAKLGLSFGALTATGYALLWLGLALSSRRKTPRQNNESLTKEPKDQSQ